jgi:hypothetical protein
MQPGIGGTGVAIAVGTVILLGGCSSSPATPTAATSPASAPSPAPVASTPAAPSAVAGGKFNSCSVVTQAEAASALGQPVSAGVLGHATVEGGLACVFYGPSAPSPRDPNVAQPDTVRVVVVTGPDALKWYKDYKSKVSAQPVSGYGDQAYYDGYASLSVLKGGQYLRIAVAPPGAPPSLPTEKKLAAAILPRL